MFQEWLGYIEFMKESHTQMGEIQKDGAELVRWVVSIRVLHNKTVFNISVKSGDSKATQDTVSSKIYIWNGPDFSG